MRLSVVLMLLMLSAGGVCGGFPQPPCQGAAYPEFSAVGATPRVGLWHSRDSSQWVPAGCLGWTEKPAGLVVAVAGRFLFAGDATALLTRFADVSAMAEIRYWSVTRSAWKPLFEDVSAYDLATKAQRADFRIDELAVGQNVHVWQRESHLPAALAFEVSVAQHTPGKLVITMANATPVRWMFAKVIDTGGYEFHYSLEREDASTWRYFNVSRLEGGGPALALVPDESFVNRAVALFRYLAGYATDTEPPAAPVRGQWRPEQSPHE